jgi:hypothetical protein
VRRLSTWAISGSAVTALTVAVIIGSPLANAGPYRSCAAAEAAGAAPMYLGDADYRSALDHDNDGVACEQGSGGAAPPPRVSAPAVVPFANVPGMATGASLGGPCTNFDRFIFGTDTAGETLACVAFGGIEGQWVSSAPLQGVQQIGAMCTNAGGDSAAQTADGRALVCVDGLSGPGGGWQPGP